MGIPVNLRRILRARSDRDIAGLSSVGWEPGVWTPEDVETTAADRSFSAKFKRFGSAVGVPSGQPA